MSAGELYLLGRAVGLWLEECCCGVDQVVEILNSVDRGTEKHIMEILEIEDPELADEIRKKMFVFEDILLLDSRSIQRVLRDVDNNELGLALKGSQCYNNRQEDRR